MKQRTKSITNIVEQSKYNASQSNNRGEKNANNSDKTKPEVVDYFNTHHWNLRDKINSISSSANRKNARHKSDWMGEGRDIFNSKGLKRL